MHRAAMLNCELEVAEVPSTFKVGIPASGTVFL